MDRIGFALQNIADLSQYLHRFGGQPGTAAGVKHTGLDVDLNPFIVTPDLHFITVDLLLQLHGQLLGDLRQVVHLVIPHLTLAGSPVFHIIKQTFHTELVVFLAGVVTRHRQTDQLVVTFV